jgi:hypothetical protein
MLYPMTSQTREETETRFLCERMARTIPYSSCMKWFVDSNALKRTDSPCFKCVQGQDNREEYARA